MGVKVLKFGGSSVADAIQLAKVKGIIDSDPARRYVVVSAPGKRFDGDSKITDLLYLCKTHVDHNVAYDQVFQAVCDRFRAVEAVLGVDIDLEKEFSEIEENLKNGASADYVASRGEYLTAMLVAAFLKWDFVDTAGLIRFDKNGRLDDNATDEALAAALAKSERAVLPGFYGSNPDGSIRTFSRGGSDITGSLVARAVGAEVYENWTDVSGFLMADPRIVDDPVPIEKISYMELRELSYMGASVLHEDAIYPARRGGIPINIRNTNEPDNPGTTILADVSAEERGGRVVTGIAGHKDFVVITLYKNRMNQERGFVRRLLTILEDYGLHVEHLPSGIDTISAVAVKKEIGEQMEEILDEIQRKLSPERVEVFEDMALIATVGRGMAKRLGVSARLFGALSEAGVNVRMIDQGSSEMNIIIGVKNADFEKAIRAIYGAFADMR